MAPMTTQDFLVLWAFLLASMLICRCIPFFLLRGRELSQGVQDALGLIPPAAFAALVANDLIEPGMFTEGVWPAALPLVASLAVAVVAWRSKSLIASTVTGIVAFGLLMLLNGGF